MTLNKTIEYIATGLAVTGSVLLAYNPTYLVVSWYCWLLADFLWVYLGFIYKSSGIVIMHTVFLSIVLIGLYRL